MKLKPCPFCGACVGRRTYYVTDGECEDGAIHAVECENCSAHGPFSIDGEENRARDDARRAWNERSD